MELIVLALVGIFLWLLFKSRSGGRPPPARRYKTTRHEVEPGVSISITTSDDDRGSHNDGPAVDRDEWEGAFWEVAAPIPVKASLRIGYIDGAGRHTDRTVEVRQFGAFGNSALVIGKCLLRGATRTFRTDRIQSCVDMETGEIINDVRSFLQRRYDESADKTAADLLANEFDTLRVLLFVGKADGQFRAEEKAVIRDACVTITNDARLTVNMIQQLLNEMDVPSLQAFKLAVGRLAKRDSTQRALVMSVAEKIVATQKTIHPAEQEALDYMKRRLVV